MVVMRLRLLWCLYEDWSAQLTNGEWYFGLLEAVLHFAESIHKICVSTNMHWPRSQLPAYYGVAAAFSPSIDGIPHNASRHAASTSFFREKKTRPSPLPASNCAATHCRETLPRIASPIASPIKFRHDTVPNFANMAGYIDYSKTTKSKDYRGSGSFASFMIIGRTSPCVGRRVRDLALCD